MCENSKPYIYIKSLVLYPLMLNLLQGLTLLTQKNLEQTFWKYYKGFMIKTFLKNIYSHTILSVIAIVYIQNNR